MVAPIIAAAAPTVVASATNDEGIINKLFKIGVLIGFLVLAAFGIILLSIVIEISDVVGAVLSVGTSVLPVATSIPIIGPFVSVITFALSAFGWGGRK
jgi:hypothetical protein